jgi:hypothetical protein
MKKDGGRRGDDRSRQAAQSSVNNSMIAWFFEGQ